MVDTYGRWTEENRSRYENCLRGSTDKLMDFSNKLRVVDIQQSNFAR